MVDYITISGREYPVSVCWGAICEYCDLIGVSKLIDIQQIMHSSPTQMTQFLWICLWYGAKQENQTEPEIKPTDLFILVDQKVMIDFIKIISKRMAVEADPETSNEDKKKAIGQ